VTFSDDVVVLADSAGGDGTFAFLLVIGGVACIAYEVKHGPVWLSSIGVAALAGAVLVWSRRLWWRTRLVLNPVGLCFLRRGRVAEMIPADAVREVVLAESVSGSLVLRLEYDVEAVPVLPPAIAGFAERRGESAPAGTVVLGRIGSGPGAMTLRKAFRVHRLVEDAGIGEWRRISES
jgi:hypothetical protein